MKIQILRLITISALFVSAYLAEGFAAAAYRPLAADFCASSVQHLSVLKSDSLVTSSDSSDREDIQLEAAVATSRKSALTYDTRTLDNRMTITDAGLKRAACCNLGESFVATAAVDVNYSDAATGAKQIKLLGLSGTYVQMLTENIPNYRLAAAPYSLSYIPGTWMQSIQVSKGITTVKQGYEAMTGQINVEYKKPFQPLTDYLFLNVYTNTKGCIEANADATFRLKNEKWGSTLFVHCDNDVAAHDGNGDTFADMPQIHQFDIMNRWMYNGDVTKVQIGVKYDNDSRRSGQIVEHHAAHVDTPYIIDIKAQRIEGFFKNAVFVDPAHDGNLALMLSASYHKQENLYGLRAFDFGQTTLYGSLMYESSWHNRHFISTGLSFNRDVLDSKRNLQPQIFSSADVTETTFGGYAQYTLNIDDKFVLQPGIRVDNSSLWGTFMTPRIHARFAPSRVLTLRASAGKGYRTAMPMFENHYLLASHRGVLVEEGGQAIREEAWNYGINATLKVPIGGRTLTLAADYYYTNFLKQAVRDVALRPDAVCFYTLDGKSYSHVAQIEASMTPFSGFTLTAAYRYSDARCQYRGRGVLTLPMTSRHKGLISLSYATRMNIWQADVTLQLNGGGRVDAYDWNGNAYYFSESHYNAFPQLTAQLTRNFRRFAIYVGGENLTNYRQPNPIKGANDPWGQNFDATQVWGPIGGAMAYIGFRFHLAR